MWKNRNLWLVLAACALVASSCNDDNSNPSTPTPDVDYNRTYVQIERLGNPLVSEVFLDKRTHGAFNAVGPDQDEALFTAEFKGFVANVAGRNATVQNTLAAVLLPDELIIDTTKAANTSGWLSWALGSGYGGRNLSDDVVDSGLAALFGDLLDASNTTPCLASDNVDANDAAFPNTFPYLGTAH